MGSIFSSSRPEGGGRLKPRSPAPPPPAAPHDSWGDPFAEGNEGVAEPPPKSLPSRSSGHEFQAELDIGELDDRERPGNTWAAQARTLSRTHLVLRSRRMCYVGRRLLIAVHLIDDAPVPLFGRVQLCEYDGEGLYKIELELAPVPEGQTFKDWIAARAK